MRDALSLLDQLIAFGGGALSEANARAMLGTIDRGHIGRLIDALAREDGAALLQHVRELDADAPDYDRALIEMAAYLQRLAIVQIVPEAAPLDEEFDAAELARLAAALSPADVQLYYQIALGGRRDLSMAPEPRLGFEMTLLRMLAFRPETASAPGSEAPAPAPAARMRTAAAGIVPAAPAGGSAPRWPARPGPSAAGTAAPGTAAAAVTAAAAGTAAATITAVAAGNAAADAAGADAAAARAASTDGPGAAAIAALANLTAAGWPAVVDAANLTGMVRQFALNCLPASFENGVLRLRLDAAAADRRTRQIEDKLAQGLSKYTGGEVRVVYDTLEPGLITAARQRALAEQDRTADAAAAFQEDPAVRGLCERFGADIDAVSIKPVN
jgi:DNA polymerase-3 subunit gamma/tau